MAGKGSGAKWWQLVGWAGIGFAAAALLSRRRSGRPAALRPAPPEAATRPVTADPGPRPSPSLDLPPDARMSWLPGPDGSLRVAEVHPSAPRAVVFVHGLGGSLGQWAPVLGLLGPGLRGVAFDLPGHGESDGERFAVADLASALAAVVDGLGLRRFLLVGHSLGAAVAIDYAAGHGQRLDGLLLVDPNGDQSRIPQQQRRQLLESMATDAHGELEWTFRQILGSDPAVSTRVLRQLRETRPEVLVGCLRESLAYSPLASLDRYEGPVHVLLSPLNDLPYSLQRLRPDLPHRVLRDAGHWLMMERPGDLGGALGDLLERSPAP